MSDCQQQTWPNCGNGCTPSPDPKNIKCGAGKGYKGTGKCISSGPDPKSPKFVFFQCFC